MASILSAEFVKLWNRIQARAWDDPAFKKRLLRSPADVLREYGIEVPRGLRVHVTEDSGKASVTFYLAPKPREEFIETEGELEPGGGWSTW